MRHTRFVPAFVACLAVHHPARSQETIPLAPTSQFSRLGYALYGQRVAAQSDVILATASPDFAIHCSSYESGTWVDAFRSNDSSWVNEAALFPIGGESSEFLFCDPDEFGMALAVNLTGRSAVVGAPMHDELGTNAGAAFVFRAVNDSWYQSGRLHGPAMSGARFGSAVAMGGSPTRVVVGAPGNGSSGVPGQVFTFESGCENVFCAESVIESPSAETSAEFGLALATDGHVLFVGAPADRLTEDSSVTGAVYIFERHEHLPPDDRWLLTQKLQPDPGEFSHQSFGLAIALSDGPAPVLAVGAPGERNDDHRGSGMVYLFRREQGVWVKFQKLAAPSPVGKEVPAHYGQAVALSEDVLVVGSRWTPDEAGGRGSAHLYRFDGSQWVRTHVVSSPPDSPIDMVGASVAVLGDTAIIGAPGDGAMFPGTDPGAVLLVNVPHIADADGDGDADAQDAAAFASCLEGPAAPFPADMECRPFDFDRDSDVDLDDAAIVQRAIQNAQDIPFQRPARRP